MKMKILDRKEYKNRLIRLRETEKIKIISGIRGAGKSELLRSYQKWIESHLEGANILYLDMEDAQNAGLKDGPSLLSHIEKNYEEKRSNFLIVEEIQLCKNFEKAMQSVYERKMFNIYLSSSNASFLYSFLSSIFILVPLSKLVYFIYFCNYNFAFLSKLIIFRLIVIK